MKQTILAIALHLLSASQTSAFTAPITTVTCQSSTTACSVWKKKKNPNNPNVVFPVSTNNEFPSLGDVDMTDIIGALGEKRVKKMARKSKRERNQAIREGKVVLDESGRWVPRDN
eukprot:g12105.t1 g12105   contig6:1224374-1224838(+)